VMYDLLKREDVNWRVLRAHEVITTFVLS
jgi:hypothetical protein